MAELSLNQAELARKISRPGKPVTQQVIQHLTSGRNQTSKWLPEIARGLEVSVDWLVTGDEELKSPMAGALKQLDELHRKSGSLVPATLLERSWIETIRGREYAVLPSYEITAAAGDGAFADEGEPDGFQVMPNSWLKSVTRARLNDLCVIQVAGDSMWETLHSGDSVLVDRSRKTLGRPGIYVLLVDGELIVKRVQKDLQTGFIDVISDNPRYPKMTVQEEDKLRVVGRVVWIGRALG